MVAWMIKSAVVVLAFLLAAADAACPQVSLVSNFKTDKFMGVWYEIQAQDSIYQSIKSCLKSDYSLNGDTVVVSSKGLNNGKQPTTSISRMTISSNPARMLTDFIAGFSPPYEVLDTDYSSYACVHSCLSFFGLTYDYVFIYSRKRKLSQDKINHCRSLFSEYNEVDVNALKDTPQKDCS